MSGRKHRKRVRPDVEERARSRALKREKHKRIRTILAIAYGLLFLFAIYVVLSVFVFGDKEDGQKEAEKKEDVRIEINDDSEPVVPISAEDLKAMHEEEERKKREEEGLSENEVPNDETEIEQMADKLLAQMNLDEKIYQMIIVTPEQLTGTEDVTAAGETTKDSLLKYPVGGIIYFSANLKDPDQTKKMLANTAEYGLKTEGIPLFLCVDEEGGSVARIGSNKAFKTTKVSPMSQIKSADAAYEAGHTIGGYLWNLGFNVDFAPDCDVLTNPDNKVIGDRSFGSDANIVREYSAAYSNGLHDAGILSTFKHYPGHGATKDDSHEGTAVTDKTLDELKEAELVPFAYATSAGADMVMVSHISVPSILNDNTPCSLSHTMVTEILKGELAYNGIVVTDALNMAAISESYSGADAAVLAIKAGNDMLLMPEELDLIPEKVKEAIAAGEIDEEQINASVKKIIIRKLVMTEDRDKKIKEEKERKEKEEQEKQNKKNKKKK
ncbi:MAG: hypothetical protein K6F34_08955 [Lachnospiraceae bacterium]|nr:hypothetical protein [Lachnospiraceae bacterium]